MRIMDKEQITFSTIGGEKEKQLNEMFGVSPNFFRVQPSRCILPAPFVFYAQKIRDMQVYEDDVWMISYPRTGSHWGLEMAWYIGNDFDHEKTNDFFDVRNPLLEGSAVIVTGNYGHWISTLGDSFENVMKMPRPRYIKSHLPWTLLPRELSEKKPKIIYITRNPKDTCVSYYHYCRTFHDMKGNFNEFAELMLQDSDIKFDINDRIQNSLDDICLAPIGPFWDHVLPFWKMRKQENMLFLTYEEMKRDQETAIMKTAKFLGKVVTDEQIAWLYQHLKFSRMASNPLINLENVQRSKTAASKEDPNDKFIRKGKIGDWMNYMSEDLSRRFDEWSEKYLSEIGLQFQDIISDKE